MKILTAAMPDGTFAIVDTTGSSGTFEAAAAFLEARMAITDLPAGTMLWWDDFEGDLTQLQRMREVYAAHMRQNRALVEISSRPTA